MSQLTSKNFYGDIDIMLLKILIIPVSAALLNLVVITILNYVYGYLAKFLTNLEFLRTQTEYDESLTLKIYLFQFVNYYSSIFYIAFVKGKFVGYPSKYNQVFGLRQEECSPGGCLMELCIQLAIIMIGKQAINSLLEMLVPFLIKKFNNFIHRIGLSRPGSEDGSVNGEEVRTCNQWTEDFKLSPWSNLGLFEEYLEMSKWTFFITIFNRVTLFLFPLVIQYGFVTIFVVAFPLAPLFALINNVFEMRLDAKKFLAFYRRSVPKRVRDIGVWFNIMHILGKLSVISSAFIISFSSNFIPRLVYMYTNAANNYSEKGYLNSTLAYFDTRNFTEANKPINTNFENVEICRYPEYRNPPWDQRAYKRPLIYWQILAWRLIFIVVFQNVVGSIQLLVDWAIPDVPRNLSDQLKREEYLTSEIIIEQEKIRVNPF
jgi:anoctamin-1